MKKTCNTCSEVKDLELFHLSPTNKDGRQGHCKSCHSLKVWAWASESQKARRLIKAKERNSKPEVRARIREYLKGWNKRSVFRRLVSYSNNHKRYRPKEKLTAFNLWCLAHRQKLLCPYSGHKLTRDTLSLDHIIPLSQGGKNVLSNVQLVHKWVNVMKWDMSSEDFLAMCYRVNDFAARSSAIN